ncbi:hypothetical protein chiPu_0023791 [Chiloscyllium punctatum]|uniref:Uncharacterized protein n=1 Tax=Chiloscyllium punctatum TaxID=137246 RepID=A0A401TAR6_CHIPU|nr:hypothetical protein [Chiloscyllium punctatum]
MEDWQLPMQVSPLHATDVVQELWGLGSRDPGWTRPLSPGCVAWDLGWTRPLSPGCVAWDLGWTRPLSPGRGARELGY